MQLTIYVSDDDIRALRYLAGKECRTLHQEAKWLLRQAIKDAAQESHGTQEAVALEGEYATASAS